MNLIPLDFVYVFAGKTVSSRIELSVMPWLTRAAGSPRLKLQISISGLEMRIGSIASPDYLMDSMAKDYKMSLEFLNNPAHSYTPTSLV